MITTNGRQPAAEGPPTAAEMLAWSRGELPADQARRIEERLAAFPELAAVYSDPFPADDAQPDDPHYLSPDQVGARWSAFKREVHRDEPRVVRFPQILNAVAAVLILVLGGLLWQSQMKVRKLENELSTPRTPREYFLPVDGYRGRAPAGPPLERGDAKLAFAFTNGPYYETYEARIVDMKRGRTLWTKSGIQPNEAGEFEILLLDRFLQPGEYRIELYGTAGGKRSRLATYTFRTE